MWVNTTALFFWKKLPKNEYMIMFLISSLMSSIFQPPSIFAYVYIPSTGGGLVLASYATNVSGWTVSWLEAQPTGPAAKTPLPFGTQSKNTPWLLMGPATLSGAQSPLCLCLSCCKKPEAWLNLQSWGREFYSQNNKVLFFPPKVSMIKLLLKAIGL